MRLSTNPGGEWQTWLLQRVQKLRSRILLNAGYMLCGRSFQLLGRIAYFVMVAHLLGPAAYGTYVACTALCTAISPFAVLGTADVMTKYAARAAATKASEPETRRIASPSSDLRRCDMARLTPIRRSHAPGGAVGVYRLRAR